MSRWRKQGSLNILASVNQRKRSSWIWPLLLLLTGSLCRKRSLCVYESVQVYVVQYLCQSSAEQVSERSCAGVDPYSLSRYYEGNRGNGAVKLTTNFRKTTFCERKGHCYCGENNENNTAVMQCIFWLCECLYLCTLYVRTLYGRYIFPVSSW